MKRMAWTGFAFRCCATTFLVGLLNIPTVVAQVANVNNADKIEIRLKPEKKVIMLGEPMFLDFEVSNLSPEKLCLGVGGDYRNSLGRPDSFKVSVRGSDDEEVPQPQAVGLGGFNGCLHIEVGESELIRLFLPHWATLEKAGSYKVNVKRRMAFFYHRPNRSVFPDPDFVLQADVNTEFEVVSYDQNRMGEVIDSLGSVMLNIDDPRSLESAQALAYIHDNGVIGYFVEALRKFGNFEFAFGTNEYQISSRAVEVLATFDDDRAIAALEGAMDSPSEDTRLDVATAFGSSPHQSATKLLLKMQNDSYWFVRLRVAQGLNKVRTNEALSVLHKLQDDENEDVRKAARVSLNGTNQ